MHNFIEEKFQFSNGYLHYDGQFIARFKYQPQRRGWKPFKKFLMENFTVDEYFSRFEAGEAPLKILESKGFLLPHIKTLLRKAGYPQTIEGRDQYLKSKII